MTLRDAVTRLIRDEDGPTTIEYAVMLTFLVIAIFSAIEYFGGAGNGVWNKNNQYLEANVWNHGS